MKMIRKWVCLLVTGLLCSGPATVVRAQENGAKADAAVETNDTVRVTLNALEGYSQAFTFTGSGNFELHWGDGSTERIVAIGGANRVSHSYEKGGTYEVMLCGEKNECDLAVVSALEASMVYVEGGTFKNSKGKEVTLESFYIGGTEVTQAQWVAVMGKNPSYKQGEDLPVERVSWNEAVVFCERLSEVTGKKYRLPTEAEWEYAARGGQNADGTEYAGSDNIDDVAWYMDNSDNQTHPVGTKAPNGLGVYDMIGNVWEWCSDMYDVSFRVRRGCGYEAEAQYCLVSTRGWSTPGSHYINLGFRVVCER